MGRTGKQPAPAERRASGLAHRTVLGLRALVHVLLGAGGAAVILLLSRKTRSTIQTMLIAAGILVVPTVAAALLW